MSRVEQLTMYLDLKNSRGIEYGALANPIVKKSQNNVIYVDYTSTKELVEKSNTDPNVKESDIVGVDVNLSEPESAKALQDRGPFDYIVASHVFEHLPNSLAWLEEASSLLREGGIISLAIPDKRYTFDFFRRLSEPSDWLTTYIDSSERPTTAQLLDHYLNVRVVDTLTAWNEEPTLLKCPRHHNDWVALDLARIGQLTYTDCHCFVYTDSSFVAILHYIQSMKLLLNLEVLKVFPPERYSNEFIIALRVSSGRKEITHSEVSLSVIPQKYDGKIVHQPAGNRGKDDGWYLVKNGKRSWITDGAYLAKNGYKANEVIEISIAEFQAIPEDQQSLN